MSNLQKVNAKYQQRVAAPGKSLGKSFERGTVGYVKAILKSTSWKNLVKAVKAAGLESEIVLAAVGVDKEEGSPALKVGGWMIGTDFDSRSVIGGKEYCDYLVERVGRKVGTFAGLTAYDAKGEAEFPDDTSLKGAMAQLLKKVKKAAK